jgi:predicted HAD superfamily Cof-like phosphohydrolase
MSSTFCTDLTTGPRTLMKAGGQQLANHVEDLSAKELDLRIALVEEEFNEVIEAARYGLQEELSKELADLIYVTVGMALACGVPISSVYALVCESNLSKVDPDTGEAYAKNEDGKILKGPHYVDPMDKIAELYDNRFIGDE